MGFTGWKRRCALVIQHTLVPADVADFPVLLNKENLPSEMMDSDVSYAALEGGGDIRFSSDAAGATRLPCEVCQFERNSNPANANVEIWVKISLSASVDVTIYVWYGKAGQSQPARNDTYGLENVWNSNYKAVYHLSEAWGTGTGNFKDSTASVKHGTATIVSTPSYASVAGKWGGKCINASSVETHSKYARIDCSGSSPLNYSNRPMSVEFWCYPDTGFIDYQGWCVGKGSSSSVDWSMRGFSGRNDYYEKLDWCASGGTDYFSTNSITNQAWHHIAGVISATGSLDLYSDGEINGSDITTLSDVNGTNTFSMLCGQGDADAPQEPWAGKLDEIRLHNTNRTANYLLTEYRTSASPSTFVIEGTPVNMQKRSALMLALLGI